MTEPIIKECGGCGSEFTDRLATAESYDLDEPIDVANKITECPRCGGEKCNMCDMGDDVECGNCDMGED